MSVSRSPCAPPVFAPIDGGWFTMGTTRGLDDERPPHRVFVDGFEMAVCPVTRAEYERFLAATGHELPRDWSLPAFAHADLPVVGVRRAESRTRSFRGATRCPPGFQTPAAARWRRHGP
jgi:formylglycine-generating enzyme required for sulfatase activity